MHQEQTFNTDLPISDSLCNSKYTSPEFNHTFPSLQIHHVSICHKYSLSFNAYLNKSVQILGPTKIPYTSFHVSYYKTKVYCS